MAVDLAAVGVPPATPRADIAAATEHMRAALAALGFDTSRDGVQRTPERFVRALDELTWGRHLDPRRHLATTFRPEGNTSIAVRGIPVTSVCEHHCWSSTGSRSSCTCRSRGRASSGCPSWPGSPRRTRPGRPCRSG